MKKLWLGVILLGLFSCVGTAYASPGGTDRPWHIRGSGTVTVVPPFQSGTFHATHTGGGTIDGTFVIGGFPPPCDIASVPLTVTSTLTAANGDTINETESATVCQSGPNPTFHATGTYSISGGTGRFSTATGSGSTSDDYDFPNGVGQLGTFTFTQDGTISY
jgi:hypothetical protein